MGKKIKAVLFDIDDTLFVRKLAQKEVCKLIVKQMPRVFEAFSMERVQEAFLKSDKISTDIFNSGAPSEGLRDKRSRIFLQLLGIEEKYTGEIAEIYIRESPLVRAPVEGAIPVVRKLSRKFIVGVVSNGLPDVQYRKLETMDLRHLFSCIVLSEEFGIRKPDPRVFHQAVILMHLRPSECLYVGDSYVHDVIGAKNAGMQACWLNPELIKPQNETVKADFIISKLAELPMILKKYE